MGQDRTARQDSKMRQDLMMRQDRTIRRDLMTRQFHVMGRFLGGKIADVCQLQTFKLQANVPLPNSELTIVSGLYNNDRLQ